MSIRALTVVMSSLSVLACGGPKSQAAADAAPDGAPDSLATDGPDPRCASHRIVHLDVHPVRAGAAIPDGRIVVTFFQFNDDIAPRPPRFVGYDRPFAGTSTGVDIAVDGVTLPPSIDDYQACARTCLDLANPACDCAAVEPKVALAEVVVARDVDGSGAIESGELIDANIFGVGYLILGASDRTYAAPNVLDFLLRDGIQDCLAPYSILPPPPDSSFDDLGIPAQTATFTLDVCVPGDASCDDLRRPNLS